MGPEMSELRDELVDLPLSIRQLFNMSADTSCHIINPTLGAISRLSISSRLFDASSS